MYCEHVVSKFGSEVSVVFSSLQFVLLLSAASCANNTHPFNGPLSRTTRVSRYQKGKTNLDFSEARDSQWQWHPLGLHLTPDNHANTQALSFLQAGCPSCRSNNSIKASKVCPITRHNSHVIEDKGSLNGCVCVLGFVQAADAAVKPRKVGLGGVSPGCRLHASAHRDTCCPSRQAEPAPVHAGCRAPRRTSQAASEYLCTSTFTQVPSVL